LISIIIPNHNKESYLAEAFDSLLNQTYQDWEAIIVDDGSTDQSIAIIELYARKDTRFKPLFLEKQEHGGAACRNFGMDKASGEHLIFFDSDDILLPQCLENRMNFFIGNSKVDFAVFGMESFVYDQSKSGHKWIVKKEHALERFLRHELPWAIMQPIYKRTFLTSNELRWRVDISRMQDVFFHTECLLKKPVFETVPDAIDCKFRVDPKRMISDRLVHYQNWVNAVSLYYNTHLSLAIDYCDLLNEMLVRAQQVLHQAYLKKEITKAELKQLVTELASNSDSRLVQLYCFLLSNLPFHIPGIQFTVVQVLRKI
jgi:glycosyltransferase involved in cell wall biosynthesis